MFFNQKSNFETISVNQINDLLGSVELIDIREDYEYHYGHIKTAKNIPMGQILANPSQYLKLKQIYYIVCQSGSRSFVTCTQLSNKGYTVINVDGGTGSYRGQLER